ncbi:SDR family NAD(P)-dependent oxidoreductase [Millisia brevis]|uniref:SDR family NAD(P)-dependent oxidoreductase n=1 Tax=Millisia brevis TaxID=264148 RepID=UPI00082F63B1|nr:SDR family NAD(P)-dependent oxidoreductase [Millisia brevis]
MPVIAIVGAGPGLGAAVARTFGREGFAVALLARNPEKLAAVRKQLAESGITAETYVTDVRDDAAVAAALDHAAEDLGPIDVLQYSPVPSAELLKPVLDTTVDDLRAGAAFSILGPAAAVGQVLPSMRARGAGTILLVNGSSAVIPNGRVGGTSVVFAAESAYGRLLHGALETEGIRVRQLIIPGAIGGGDPRFDPDTLAAHLWELHTTSGSHRVTVGEDTE